MNNELTYGQKLVGLTFNPSGDESVNLVKSKMAEVIDLINEIYISEKIAGNQGIKPEFCSKAIDQLITAQMWAVKAITWNGTNG